MNSWEFKDFYQLIKGVRHLFYHLFVLNYELTLLFVII